MTTLREAAELALDALDSKYIVNCGAWRVQRDQAIDALRDALQREALNEVHQSDHEQAHVTAADARLIAAAPELLAALKAMMSMVNDSRGVEGYYLNGNIAEWDVFDEVHEARAAIAKAEGRT